MIGRELLPAGIVGGQLDALDQAEPAPAPPDDLGRDRQEQLVDEVAGDEVAVQVRPAFGQDDPAADPVQDGRDLRGRQPLAGSGDLDPRVGGQVALGKATRPGRRRREDHGDGRIVQPAPPEPDLAAAGDDHDRRLLGETERRAPLPERRRGRRMEMLRGPLMAAPAGDRARSHEHDVRDRAEQGHHEAIGLVVTADHPSTGLLAGPERDDPVERRDEVHQDGGPVGPQRDREWPAVRRPERVGHRLAPVLTDRRGGAPELLDGDRRGRWMGRPRRVGHPVEGTGSRLPADARDDRDPCR